MRMAAIYARVSSEQQREAHAIASQTAALIEWAKTTTGPVGVACAGRSRCASGITERKALTA